MAKLPEEKKEDETSSTVQSKTMKAVICTEYGEPTKVLKLMDVPMCTPKDTELLVEIHSAALNPVDYKMVKGNVCSFHLKCAV